LERTVFIDQAIAGAGVARCAGTAIGIHLTVAAVGIRLAVECLSAARWGTDLARPRAQCQYGLRWQALTIAANRLATASRWRAAVGRTLLVVAVEDALP
jgi:hypothetical protein